jgi:hypothetical protein
MGGACSTYGGEERCIQVLVGTPEKKKPLGRLSRRWENNNMMDLQEVGCEVMDWIELAQNWNRW